MVNKRLMKASNMGRENDARTISDHDLSESQSGAGFEYGLFNATPPVSRKRHTLSSILLLHGTWPH